MKAPAFRYLAPDTLAEALRLLAWSRTPASWRADSRSWPC